MLNVHRAERADALVGALGALLAAPPADPFAGEVVAVPTRGMERWLAQRLSAGLGARPGRGDGVCANVAFPSPGRLARDAVATASGIAPEADPWLPERAVWPLLEVADACLREPWLDRLAEHLGAPDDEVRQGRRFGTLRHLAGLFDRYALHRPGMVRAWAAGGDGGLGAEWRWQAELWRRLRERIAIPDGAERVEAACARLRDDPAVVGLPQRLSLFGLTRLPAGHLRVLRSLAAGRDVHLFLLHPSPALWSAVAGATAGAAAVVRRRDDRTATLPANRLLASWGRDAREMQLVVGTTEHVDHHHAVEHAGATLLARLQADVRADRPAPADAGRALLQRGDRSVEVHACHGRARQVEVLRDAILHLLEEDATLEPRDVIVMCPDIEAFAPLVHATFGAAASAEDDELAALPPDVRPPDLRVRLADRALRQTNPLLGVVAQLLDLARERLTASQLLDLAGRDPVRRRFDLDDDDLARLEDWVSTSGIRWGLDAAHRGSFKLEAVAAGTWRAGLDRVLVGVTMTEDGRRLFERVLPLDDVESGDIDLAGRLAELVERAGACLDDLRSAQAVDAWAAAIGRAADLLTATPHRDAWQRAELDRLLADVVAEATAATDRAATELAPAEVEALLGRRLEGRPTRANFRTGHLTICTLMPMRSVPHRVVCLLGLDDGVFPRRGVRDGDDLMLDDPHVGERDARAEDRQLLLDALMAAEERLIVTYTGNDERTNAVRPPAVPVGELLDAVDRTVRTDDGARSRDRIEVRHPLQPFDPRNFVAGELAGNTPWSFNRVTLAGARALTGDRGDPPPFLAGPLPDERAALVELDDLVRVVQHPAKAFLRRRLGIALGDFSAEIEDALPVELDGLEKWGVGRRMLEARLEGCDARAAYRSEIARGLLPPGELGRPVVEELLPTVQAIVEAADELLGAGAAASAEVRVGLPGGRALAGTVAGVRGDALLTTTFSRIAPKHRLAAWVRLLALTATDPDPGYRAVTIGRAPRGGAIAVATIPPLHRAAAHTHLVALVDLRDRAMREPLRMACRTSAAYARAARAGGDAWEQARDAWESGFNRPAEDVEPEHELVHGGAVPFAELVGGGPVEASDFARSALALWAPLLDVEDVVER